jgi:hypothetical protein
MNIFYLHPDPKICAQYHVDKHVNKMILESTQMLMNAYYLEVGITKWSELSKLDSISRENKLKKIFEVFNDTFPRIDEYGYIKPYRPAHWNHPSSQWVRESKENFEWLLSLASELVIEKKFRTGKGHKCEFILEWCKANPPKLQSNGAGKHNQIKMAFGDEYKKTDSVMENYRVYYRDGKSHLHKWTKREIPDFILQNL